MDASDESSRWTRPPCDYGAGLDTTAVSLDRTRPSNRYTGRGRQVAKLDAAIWSLSWTRQPIAKWGKKPMKVRARSSQRGARGWCVSTYVGVRALLRVCVCGCMCVGVSVRVRERFGFVWRVCKILCVKASPSCWTQRGWSGQGASYVLGVETVGDFVCVCGAEGARARSRELEGAGPRARRQSRFVSP